jgi:hypothetical protein
MQEKENVIEILQAALKAIKEGDIMVIKELSNRTVHTSSIQQDPDNINIAVILYALSKILERTRYQEMPGWNKFERVYEQSLENALVALKKNDIQVYRDQIARIEEIVDKISGHLKVYIKEVFRKASISKASRLYEHGISREAAAKILGISQWELAQYIGNTGIADVNLAYTLDIKKRLKNAEEMFK